MYGFCVGHFCAAQDVVSSWFRHQNLAQSYLGACKQSMCDLYHPLDTLFPQKHGHDMRAWSEHRPPGSCVMQMCLNAGRVSMLPSKCAPALGQWYHEHRLVMGHTKVTLRRDILKSQLCQSAGAQAWPQASRSYSQGTVPPVMLRLLSVRGVAPAARLRLAEVFGQTARGVGEPLALLLQPPLHPVRNAAGREPPGLALLLSTPGRR